MTVKKQSASRSLCALLRPRCFADRRVIVLFVLWLVFYGAAVACAATLDLWRRHDAAYWEAFEFRGHPDHTLNMRDGMTSLREEKRLAESRRGEAIAAMASSSHVNFASGRTVYEHEQAAVQRLSARLDDYVDTAASTVPIEATYMVLALLACYVAGRWMRLSHPFTVESEPTTEPRLHAGAVITIFLFLAVPWIGRHTLTDAYAFGLEPRTWYGWFSYPVDPWTWGFRRLADLCMVAIITYPLAALWSGAAHADFWRKLTLRRDDPDGHWGARWHIGYLKIWIWCIFLFAAVPLVLYLHYLRANAWRTSMWYGFEGLATGVVFAFVWARLLLRASELRSAWEVAWVALTPAERKEAPPEPTEDLFGRHILEVPGRALAGLILLYGILQWTGATQFLFAASAPPS